MLKAGKQPWMSNAEMRVSMLQASSKFFHSTTLTTAFPGLVVLERNYLMVYPYDKWVGHVVPEFEEGEEFQPSVCELREGKTTKPSLLTEADLVALMDKNGIGTHGLNRNSGLCINIESSRD